MKYYSPENAAFVFPFNLDVARLCADLEKCMEFNFTQNYIPQNYNGKDYLLPLRSIDGRLDVPIALPFQQDRYKDTVVLEHCPYFKQIIDQFLCDKESIRLMKLPPGAGLNTHTDHKGGYEDGVFRLHIPITTNDSVYFILNDKRLRMEAGTVWYGNFSLPHSVENKGDTNRIHLVIDCIRNDWSDDLFRSAGYDFSQEEKEADEEIVEEEIPLIIEELRRQNTPQANALAAQLNEQLLGKS